MCCGCWEDEGSPRIDNERVRGVQLLIEAVYDHNGVGGNLHIVLDDNNIEDGNLAFCLETIDRGGHPEDPNHSPWYTQSKLDDPDSPEQLAAERACCVALQAMTYEERASAMGLWDGCWS